MYYEWWIIQWNLTSLNSLRHWISLSVDLVFASLSFTVETEAWCWNSCSVSVDSKAYLRRWWVYLWKLLSEGSAEQHEDEFGCFWASGLRVLLRWGLSSEAAVWLLLPQGRTGKVTFISAQYQHSQEIKLILCCAFIWSSELQLPLHHTLRLPTLSHGYSYVFYEVANSYEFVRPHSYDFVRFL